MDRNLNDLMSNLDAKRLPLSSSESWIKIDQSEGEDRFSMLQRIEPLDGRTKGMNMKSAQLMCVAVVLLLVLPTLMVHHKKNDCVVTAYELATALMRSLTHAPKKELLTFSGGDLSVSDPCKASSSHGFLGIDAEVVTAITSWIEGAATPNV